MFALFALVFLFGAAQQPGSKQPDPNHEQLMREAREKVESARKDAIHINELAGNIHSEADAQKFVDAIAERVTGKENDFWTSLVIRHRAARAEYDAVSDPSRLIPEQRIVNVWNEYVREIGAPEGTQVTAAEIHNLRDAMYTGNVFIWKREGFPQSIWTMPNVYALDDNGKVAAGCRAIEALKILHDMFRFPQVVQRARDRVRKGVLFSDIIPQRQQDAAPRPVKSELRASAQENRIMSAAYGYLQTHDGRDYQRLLERLFTELFSEN